MTSSFGEYRPGHLHAGIDIKTWGLEGYPIFAIESGSVVKVEVSPYGYGRAVYLLLDNGMKVIYAHLSRFSDPIEWIIREEQKLRRRFAVEKFFAADFIRVEKGELVGYTGSSGTGESHLHLEVRDAENRPFNPLLLGYPIKDTTPPTLQGVAASPLSFGSHVDGDFLPKVFPLQREREGIFFVVDTVKAWGRIGLSLSAFDQADEAFNKFAVYKIRLFLDGKLAFSVRYDRFSYGKTQLVDLDRDYRLNKWGWGIYQKLYRDVGNDLPFYEPTSMEAGVICCWDKGQRRKDLERLPQQNPVEQGGSFFVDAGDHSFQIQVMDYFGNLSEANGILRMVPLSEVWVKVIANEPQWEKEPSVNRIFPKINVEKHFFEEYIRFNVSSDQSLPGIPYLFVSISSVERTFVPLIPKSAREFVGSISWDEGVEGNMITEVGFTPLGGCENVIKDTMEVFVITPERGGTIVSSDGDCKVIFREGSLYQSIIGGCRKKIYLYPAGIPGQKYDVFPQDVPVKRKIKVQICALNYGCDKEKMGIYRVGKDGSVSFAGNKWENGTISAWTETLGEFTVLQDTVAPEILSIRPEPDVYIQERSPKIAVEFRDTLSGIYGEANYIIRLDNIPLIVEYDPENDIGFCQIEEPLSLGEHVLDVMIKDRAGNTAEIRSRFFIDLE